MMLNQMSRKLIVLAAHPRCEGVAPGTRTTKQFERGRRREGSRPMTVSAIESLPARVPHRVRHA